MVTCKHDQSFPVTEETLVGDAVCSVIACISGHFFFWHHFIICLEENDSTCREKLAKRAESGLLLVFRNLSGVLFTRVTLVVVLSWWRPRVQEACAVAGGGREAAAGEADSVWGESGRPTATTSGQTGSAEAQEANWRHLQGGNGTAAHV